MKIRSLPIASTWAIVMMLLASGVVSPASSAVTEPDLLDPEKAFRISTRALDPNHVEVQFAIADGYYMYRDRFKFETAAGRLLADVELPHGKAKEDQFFGKTEIYRREVRIRVPVTSADTARGNVKLKVTSQGCADIGICYVPLAQMVEVRLPDRSSNAPAAGMPPLSSGSAGLPKAPHKGAPAESQEGSR